MSWVIFKYYLKKAWLFLKKWWWAISLFIIGTLLRSFFRNYPRDFGILYDARVERTKNEIKLLEDSHKEEKKQKKDQEDKYRELVKIVEEKRKLEGKKIRKEEKKRIKEIVKKPLNEQAKMLADEYGFEVVENK